MKILLIEGDCKVADGVRRALASADTTVYDTDDGDDAVELARIYAYDLIVLGETLVSGAPDRVLRRLRDNRVAAPVMVLSADNAPAQIVEMLNGGADEYAVRPVHRDVLAATAKAIVRRAQGRPSNDILVGPIKIDENGATVDGKPVRLTGSEYKLLACLASRKGVTVSRDAILSALYTHESREADIKIIDVLVCKIRAKLRVHGAAGHLATDWGKGYALTEVAGSDAATAHFSTENGIGRILTLMADSKARVSAQVARAIGESTYATHPRLAQMREKGWLSNDVQSVGRRKMNNWTITQAGLAELAERRETEQRIKEAA